MTLYLYYLVTVLAVTIIFDIVDSTPISVSKGSAFQKHDQILPLFRTKMAKTRAKFTNVNDELLGNADHCTDWINKKLKNSALHRNINDLALAIVRSGFSTKIELNFEYLIFCGLNEDADNSSPVELSLKHEVEALSNNAKTISNGAGI